ncbi:hypothetical protein ACEVG1_00670 [Parapedobacter sp. 2B3]
MPVKATGVGSWTVNADPKSMNAIPIKMIRAAITKPTIAKNLLHLLISDKKRRISLLITNDGSGGTFAMDVTWLFSSIILGVVCDKGTNLWRTREP